MTTHTFMDTIGPIRNNFAWIALAAVLLGVGILISLNGGIPAERALAPGILATVTVFGMIAYQSVRLSRSVEARAKAIVDRAADAIITTDERGIIESANAAATDIFGYREAELQGHEVATLLSSVYEDSEDDSDLWNFLRRNAIGTSGQAQEVIGVRRNGDRFFMELSISDALINNRIIFVAIMRDVTNKKKIEIELRQAHDELEKRVEKRTLDLKSSNMRLKSEVSERERAQRELEDALAELKKAMQEIKTLSGFIPICASCKKVRNDDGFWDQIEGYISERSDARFSHGFCPECKESLYPGLGKKDG